MCVGWGTLEAREAPEHKVLFICTGNFFRSAFAELYFNHLAAQNLKLDPRDPRRKQAAWRAESRGLDPAQLSPSQRAARMSSFAVERLRKLRIPYAEDRTAGLPAHTPTPLGVADLERCERAVAMHDASHRPMLRRFVEKRRDQVRDPAALLGRVVYWNIDDVAATPAVPLTPRQQAERALDEVQRAVEALFASL
jgi:protein-tyrosine phosphatase